MIALAFRFLAEKTPPREAPASPRLFANLRPLPPQGGVLDVLRGRAELAGRRANLPATAALQRRLEGRRGRCQLLSPAAAAPVTNPSTAALCAATVLATAPSVVHLNFGMSGRTPASTSPMIANPSHAASQSSLLTTGGRGAFSGVGGNVGAFPRTSSSVSGAKSKGIFGAALVGGLTGADRPLLRTPCQARRPS